MEAIVLNHEAREITDVLGVSQERLEEIEKEINALLNQDPLEAGFAREEDEETISVKRSYVMDVLLNKVSKTEVERMLLFTQVESVFEVIDDALADARCH